MTEPNAIELLDAFASPPVVAGVGRRLVAAGLLVWPATGRRGSVRFAGRMFGGRLPGGCGGGGSAASIRTLPAQTAPA
jgi:hypothetical protein